MSQMINNGSEMLRISPSGDAVEYSTNGGRTWNSRYRTSSSTGEFLDLFDNGNELLAVTTNGIYFSSNDGKSWNQRCKNNSAHGDFLQLSDGGRELLANTTIGLFYSTNDGRSWNIRSRR